nr:MAG TPA: cysteine sulfinate desulfinase/cysteine desulfurase [Caudoviricetes sp.]
MIYLDSAATTFPKHQFYGCASWLNANTPYGAESREALFNAENSVKHSLGVSSGKVVFGGTASVMFKYLFDKIGDAWCDSMSDADEDESKKNKIKWHSLFSSPYEHECIANGEKGIYICDIDELKDKDIVKDKMWRNCIPITFCQLVSNITGEVFPVVDIGTVARELNGFFVCDMTASIGKYDIPDHLEDFCDCVIASAHKFHGKKGQGFIWVSDRFNEWLNGIDYIGTPDVSGAANTAYALMRAMVHYYYRQPPAWDNAVRDALFKQGVKHSVICLFGAEDCVRDIVCLRIYGVYADALQNFLASKEIYIGVGHSSCEDGKGRYRVLMHAGYSEKEASECIRLSFDGGVHRTTQNEIDEFAKAVKEFIVTYGISQEEQEEENEGN